MQTYSALTDSLRFLNEQIAQAEDKEPNSDSSRSDLKRKRDFTVSSMAEMVAADMAIERRRAVATRRAQFCEHCPSEAGTCCVCGGITA